MKKFFSEYSRELRDFAVIAVLFFEAALLASAVDSWVLLTVLFAVLGFGTAHASAALKGKKPSKKLVIGWTVIAGVFGLLAGLFGV